MDLDEWEYIPDEGFLEIHDDGGNKIVSRKKYFTIDSNIMFKDYFKNPQFVDSTEKNPNFPNQIVPIPIPIQFQRIIPPQITTERSEPVRIQSTKPESIKIDSPKSEHVTTGSTEVDPVAQDSFKKMKESVTTGSKEIDPVVQVSFKKTKETHEFVDMKMDSPRSGKRVIVSEVMEMKKELGEDEEVVIWGESGNEGLNIWKWGLNGIGAICSFGVVVATVCIIVLGSGNKQRHQISFHVYQDDNKRISQVVNKSKYSEAISAAKGVPLTRARVTFGGYIDAI